MPRSTRLRHLGSAVACLLLALPGTVAAQDDPASPAPSLAVTPSAAPAAASPVGAWSVRAYDPWSEGLVEPREGSALRLGLLDGGDLQGATGCGRFEGGYSLEGDQLWLGVAPTGNLGCSDALTAEAVGLSAALDAVGSWRAAPDEGGVELLDELGAVRVVLVPDVGADPTGAWSVVSYARQDGTLVEPDPVAPMSLELDAVGAAEGSTGCRLFEGVYRREGESISIGPVETVGLPCEQPQRRAERRLLAALVEAYHWQREDDVLTLTDAFGQPLLVLRATAPDEAVP